MPNSKLTLVTNNQWKKLKAFTSARIAVGRAGISIPTNEMLKFQLDHAQARDAVHVPLNPEIYSKRLNDGLAKSVFKESLFVAGSPLVVASEARERSQYLQRPDLGRQLNQTSQETLKAHAGQYDLAICIVDGLSSKAIEQNALPFIQTLLVSIAEVNMSVAPLTVCTQGRVAVGDEITELLGAKTAIVLIGERPGLMSPDSMGLYLTYGAKKGCNDAQRNCISNIRPDGLSYIEAVNKAMYLINESNRLKLSGVNLKERSTSLPEADRNVLPQI